MRELGGASGTLVQVVSRDGQRLCESDIVVALVAVSGKPLRLSQSLRAAFGVAIEV